MYAFCPKPVGHRKVSVQLNNIVKTEDIQQPALAGQRLNVALTHTCSHG